MKQKEESKRVQDFFGSHRKDPLQSLPCMRFFFLILLGWTLANAGDSLQTERRYGFLFGPPEEMEGVAATSVGLNKSFQDLYYRGFGPWLPENTAPWVEGFWNVFWTYFFSIGPHEYGHWARAQQAGGDFIFEEFGFPFPAARMQLPPSLSPAQGTLASIGGFEINHLMKMKTQGDFYRNGYGHSDEMIHSFIQEVYYPFYAFVVAPADPEDPLTWINTRGDPVEAALSAYLDFGKGPVLDPDTTVNPDLVKLYKQTVYTSLFWTLCDPMLYQSAKGFGKSRKDPDGGLIRPWMIGNDTWKWMYGTAFCPSPFGYGVYLFHYIQYNKRLMGLYLRTGKPYKCQGGGVFFPNLIHWKKAEIGFSVDGWNQAYFGKGGAFSLEAKLELNRLLGLDIKTGWKSEGYLLGRSLEKGPLLMAGFHSMF